jgi:hypothetical protein
MTAMCYRYNCRGLQECNRLDDLLGHVTGRLISKAFIDGKIEAEIR